MARTSQAMKIGVIGSDSTHVVAFSKRLNEIAGIDVAWIDINNYTTLPFSGDRAPHILEQLHLLGIPLVEGYRHNEIVDAYCILNIDAGSHRNIINYLSTLGKPIFVDKPIFYDVCDFQDITQALFSSSALRYCSFVKRAYKHLNDTHTHISIEGPLSFIEGIEGYFWYGIHLIEIVHTLGEGDIHIQTVHDYGDFEIVEMTCGLFHFVVKGIKVGNPDFKINYNDTVYSISEDKGLIYDNLIDEILMYFKSPKGYPTGYEIIKAIQTINTLRKGNHYGT